MDDVLDQAGDVSGKVIVICSLPMNNDNTDLALAHTSSGAVALAKRVPGAEVVAAFNSVPSEVFFGVFEARRGAAFYNRLLFEATPQPLIGRVLRHIGKASDAQETFRQHCAPDLGKALVSRICAGVLPHQRDLGCHDAGCTCVDCRCAGGRPQRACGMSSAAEPAHDH